MHRVYWGHELISGAQLGSLLLHRVASVSHPLHHYALCNAREVASTACTGELELVCVRTSHHWPPLNWSDQSHVAGPPAKWRGQARTELVAYIQR